MEHRHIGSEFYFYYLLPVPEILDCKSRSFMKEKNNIQNLFPCLGNYLNEHNQLGLSFNGDAATVIKRKEQKSLALKFYWADSETAAIVNHNIAWARGLKDHPIFQFAYLMLPTMCNQACSGCFMGQDKGRLPKHLDGPFFSDLELSDIAKFLKQHHAKAIVYGGGGELFSWDGAFEFVEKISKFGLHPVIFTNGTLLTSDDVKKLNHFGTSLIISIRDTVEEYHNKSVKANNFRSSLLAIEYALQAGMNVDARLAVEIPVTKDNETRIINDLLPVLRQLNIVPMVEEYIQLSVSIEEQASSHDFTQARSFFKNISAKDVRLGSYWIPENGTRMLGQPKCQRPLYSFAIFPSRDVLDCPSHSIKYGNLKNQTLQEIIYSDEFKKNLLNFNLCACSVFYTESDATIPQALPEKLVVFK